MLTSDEYDKVIEYYTELNRDYPHFEENAVSLLAELFGFRLTAYCVYKSRDGRVEADRMFSQTLRRDILQRYQSEAVFDNPLIVNYARLCYEYTGSYYLADRCLKSGDLMPGTAYERLLREFNIGHYAVLGVNNSTRNLVHLIHIFRPVELGDFTEHELELFQIIGKVFNRSKNLYSANFRYVKQVETLLAYCDTADFGFAVLDYKGRLIQQNSLFKRYSSRISSGLTDDEVISDVLEAVIGKKDLFSSPNFLKTARFAGLEIIVRMKRVEMSHGIEKLTFITINPLGSKKALTFDRAELSARFGLTKREGEVAELIVRGCDNREIADDLFIALPTVKAHVGHILQKSGVRTRAEFLWLLRNPGL